MKLPKLNVETGLFLLALVLAGAVRLSGLGSATLNDQEASLALQALGIVRGGGSALIGPHPLYLALTSVVMFLFGSSNFAARVWPALAGSLLVLTPFYFRNRLGRLPAVLLAFFLAIDPGLAAVSRQAGGPSLALAAVFFAVGLWNSGYPAAAGIAAGLSLLSGPWVWAGWLGLALAGWGYRTFLHGGENASEDAAPEMDLRASLRRAGWFALGTFLFGGSLFFFVPQGWSAAASSLAAFVQSWYQPSGVPVVRVGQALLWYEFLPVIAGLACVVVYRKYSAVRFLAIWVLAGLILAAAPVGRQTASLVWVSVPVWGLTAVLAASIFARPAADRLPTLAQSLLGIVILGFLSLTAVGISAVGAPQSAEWVALIAALALLLLTTLLVAWGWSVKVAWYGLVWSFSAVLLAYTLMSTWNAAGLSGRRPVELWTQGANIRDGDLIRQTIGDLSLWNVGARNRLDVVVMDEGSPALRWLLRDQSQVSYTRSLTVASTPALVITMNLDEPKLGASYRGQDFILEEAPVWNISSLKDWFRWLVFREVPVESHAVVLWARTDLFPGEEVQSQALPEQQPVPESQENPRQ